MMRFCCHWTCFLAVMLPFPEHQFSLASRLGRGIRMISLVLMAVNISFLSSCEDLHWLCGDRNSGVQVLFIKYQYYISLSGIKTIQLLVFSFSSLLIPSTWTLSSLSWWIYFVMITTKGILLKKMSFNCE